MHTKLGYKSLVIAALMTALMVITTAKSHAGVLVIHQHHIERTQQRSYPDHDTVRQPFHHSSEQKRHENFSHRRRYDRHAVGNDRDHGHHHRHDHHHRHKTLLWLFLPSINLH